MRPCIGQGPVMYARPLLEEFAPAPGPGGREPGVVAEIRAFLLRDSLGIALGAWQRAVEAASKTDAGDPENELALDKAAACLLSELRLLEWSLHDLEDAVAIASQTGDGADIREACPNRGRAAALSVQHRW